MKYVLLGLTPLLTTPIISNVAFNPTTVSAKNETSGVNRYRFENSKYQYQRDESTIDDTVEYRLYIDSSKDQLTPADNKIDFNWGYLAKDTWHDLELPVATYNFKDFDVANKSDLISVIGNKFSLDYYYAFNMWDSHLGWKYSGGKNVELKQASSTVDLKTEAHTDEVQYDIAGSKTEAGRIQIRQQWGTEGLKIFLRMSVWYTWKSGSIYNHASLTKFSLTDINNGGTSKIKFGNKTSPVFRNQSLLPGSYSWSLTSLFNQAREIYEEKEKNKWLTVLPLFTSYSIAGPLSCTNGVFGSGYINLFGYETLMRDIALTMQNGIKDNARLELVNTTSGLMWISSLYYWDLTGVSHFIGQAQVPTVCTSIMYVGVATLSYMYLTD